MLPGPMEPPVGAPTTTALGIESMSDEDPIKVADDISCSLLRRNRDALAEACDRNNGDNTCGHNDRPRWCHLDADCCGRDRCACRAAGQGPGRLIAIRFDDARRGRGDRATDVRCVAEERPAD